LDTGIKIKVYWREHIWKISGRDKKGVVGLLRERVFKKEESF
jgi:hypothetical protein